jgi:CheY-like chemotaxis protein
VVSTRPRPGEKISILLVDDDKTTLMITRAILESAGYQVSVRDSALGTSAAILRERPDVVLMDVEMPGLSGDRLVGLLRGSLVAQEVMFILYSGTRSEDLDALVAETGAAGGIAKTGDQHRFVSDFERILKTARRAR